jgi:hypothetical protein
VRDLDYHDVKLHSPKRLSLGFLRTLSRSCEKEEIGALPGRRVFPRWTPGKFFGIDI